MEQTFIRFEELHKAFGPKKVLNGLTLEIRRGETIVVIGGSGSGKSVLLRHVIGLHRPDSGRVFVEGEDVTDLDESDLMPVRRKTTAFAGAILILRDVRLSQALRIGCKVQVFLVLFEA